LGNLQWRILHGAVAVNAFISVINPNVSNGCPCKKKKIESNLSYLNCFFNKLNYIFTIQSFIFGYRYVAKNRIKCQFLNLNIGEAKMAIYLSRKNKIEGSEGCEVVD